MEAATSKSTFDGVVVRCRNALERQEHISDQSSTAPTNTIYQDSVSHSTDIEKKVVIRMTLSELPTTDLATAVSYVRKDTFDSLDRFVIEQSLTSSPGAKHTKRTLVDELSGRVMEAI